MNPCVRTPQVFFSRCRVDSIFLFALRRDPEVSFGKVLSKMNSVAGDIF